MNNVLIENLPGYVYLLQGKEPRQRDTTKNSGRHTKHRAKALPSVVTTPVCCQLWHIGHWPNKHRTNLRPHRPKWKEVCSTHFWVRERTKLAMKWSWAGHINRLTRTSRVTTWRPYHVKGDQPSGGETTQILENWQRTAQDRAFGDDMLRPSPNHGTQRLPMMMVARCSLDNN